MGIGFKRQAVGFTWHKTLPSVFASTRTKLSTVSSGKSKLSVLFKIVLWSDKMLALIESNRVLLLEWSAYSSHKESVVELLFLLNQG